MTHWQSLLLIALALYVLFRDRVWGLLDPLYLFLAIRIAAGIAVVAHYFAEDRINAYVVHMIVCIVLFTSTLLLASPKTKSPSIVRHAFPTKFETRWILNAGHGLILFKALLLLAVISDLPIFSGDQGSDSYIDFDYNNKLVSSLLLGIGSADLVILWCVVPLLKNGFRKWVGWLALLLTFLVSLVFFKKASVIGIVFAMGLGEYLRVYVLRCGTLLFARSWVVLVALMPGISWLLYVLGTTFVEFEYTDVSAILDFIAYQFMYPYLIYGDGLIHAFAEQYKFNGYLYFFHSLLSPFGFPAFEASIGPALQEYQTGVLSGQGINPTFVIEGYVVFGSVFSLVYCSMLGLILGFFRK